MLGALFVGALALVSACGEDESSSSAAPAAGQEAAAAALEQDAVVIDVRTPEEYDAGHIEGAQLLDIQSADFADGMAELDADQTYVVYCRSGNRSAAATGADAGRGSDRARRRCHGRHGRRGWPEA